MKSITLTLFASAAVALAQAPSPRSEVAFRTSGKVGIREFTPAAQPGALGHEILLMQESRPFIVRANVSPNYTTNAFSDYTERADWSLDGSLSLGVETVLAGKLLLHAEIAAGMARYMDSGSLDRDSLGALFSAAYALTGSTTLAAAYSGQKYMEPGFGDEYLSTHTLLLRLNQRAQLGDRLVLDVSPFAQLTSADPADYDQRSLGASVALLFQQTRRVQWGLAGTVQWTEYEHYFRGLFPADREDFTWALAAWWAYRYSDRLELRLDARFSQNESNLSAFDLARGRFVGLYDSSTLLFTPAVTVNWQF